MFKLTNKVLKKKVVAEGVFSYINELDHLTSITCSATDYKHFLDLENITLALKVNVAMKLKKIMKKREASTTTKKDFMNSVCSTEIVKVSQAHIKYITFLFFKNGLAKLKCPINKQNLTWLCALNGLTQLMTDSTSCYEAKYFNENSSDYVLDAVLHINKELRPYVINIIETVDIPDVVLASAIGNSYGDIYETHLEWAKNSKLNKTKLGDAIPDGYMEYM